MKKLLYTCLLMTGLLLVNQATANAQIGIRGGVNFANVTGDVDNTDARTGLMVGVYTSFAVPGSPISIQPEVLYSQQGYKMDDPEFGEATAKIDYIKVPVLAKFSFGGGGMISPQIYAGPYIGFKANAKAEVDGEEQDIENIKSTDFGVSVGADLFINSLFSLGARYSAGLTSIADEGGADVNNSVFSIVAGIEF